MSRRTRSSASGSRCTVLIAWPSSVAIWWHKYTNPKAPARIASTRYQPKRTSPTCQGMSRAARLKSSGAHEIVGAVDLTAARCSGGDGLDSGWPQWSHFVAQAKFLPPHAWQTPDERGRGASLGRGAGRIAAGGFDASRDLDWPRPITVAMSSLLRAPCCSSSRRSRSMIGSGLPRASTAARAFLTSSIARGVSRPQSRQVWTKPAAPQRGQFIVRGDYTKALRAVPTRGCRRRRRAPELDRLLKRAACEDSRQTRRRGDTDGLQTLRTALD